MKHHWYNKLVSELITADQSTQTYNRICRDCGVDQTGENMDEECSSEKEESC